MAKNFLNDVLERVADPVLVKEAVGFINEVRQGLENAIDKASDAADSLDEALGAVVKNLESQLPAQAPVDERSIYTKYLEGIGYSTQWLNRHDEEYLKRLHDSYVASEKQSKKSDDYFSRYRNL